MIYAYRRPTRSWVRVIVRQCRELGLHTEVLREGEPRRGTVLLKIGEPRYGYRMLMQTRDAEGQPRWLPSFGDHLISDSEAEAYVARTIERDPDLWVIEIDDPDGRTPFTEATL